MMGAAASGRCPGMKTLQPASKGERDQAGADRRASRAGGWLGSRAAGQSTTCNSTPPYPTPPQQHSLTAQEESPTTVSPSVQEGVGACRLALLSCWQGDDSRKPDCTAHWPWL